MLDAIENSIINPPGFVDPIAEFDDLLMDDLARQLDQVESSMENTPQTTPQPDVFDDGDGTVGSETPAVPEGFGTPEFDEKIDSGDFGSSEQSAVSDSSINSIGSTQSMAKSPLNRNDSKRERERRPFKRYGSGRRGSTGARASQNMQFCFESHECID